MTPHPLKRLRLIWGALVVGVVSYSTVAWALVSFGGVGQDLLPPNVMNGGGALAIIMMAGALFVRRSMVEKISRDLPEEQRIAQYLTATLVGLATIESVGLFVITLAMMTGAATWILAGGGAAALLMMTARPAESEIGLD